jgi:hypothetical protein
MTQALYAHMNNKRKKKDFLLAQSSLVGSEGKDQVSVNSVFLVLL